MQLLYVFRGCLLAYAFGVVVMALATMFIDGRGPEAWGIIALFGAFLLVPFLFIVSVIWMVLAGMEKTVTALQAAAICAAVFFCLAVLLGVADGGLPGLLISAIAAPFVGAVFGAIFWIGAFGFRRDMAMGKRMPKDWR